MDKQHMKAQSAMEFMILVGILLFIFSMMLGVISSKTTYIAGKRESITGEDIATKIQKEINLAARVLDGYYREFTLPAKIGNKDYDISITGNEVILSLEGQDFWRVIPSVVGNITKGDNKINKTNGIIYLN
ncbi:hypothetical protein KY360_06405 [Candidatus Woesearchaeota archaeon]|nr:hypothetical protein [Candidatus Woesearchaeota archaeon]